MKMRKKCKVLLMFALITFSLFCIFSNKTSASEIEREAVIKYGEKTTEGIPVEVTFSTDISGNAVDVFSEAGWSVNGKKMSRIFNPSDRGIEYVGYIEYTNEDEDGNTIKEIAKIAVPYTIDLNNNIGIGISTKVENPVIEDTSIVDLRPLNRDEDGYFMCGKKEGKTKLKGKYHGYDYVWEVNVIDTGEKNEANDEYELAYIPFFGGLPEYKLVGQSIDDEIFLTFYNKTKKRTVYIDTDKLKLSVSDSNIATPNGWTATAKKEGFVTLKYTYTYNGKDYSEEIGHVVLSDKDTFEGTALHPYLKTPIISLEVGSEGKKEELYYAYIGTWDSGIPDGYDEKSYFKVEWSIEDEEVAKIEKISDEEIKVVPVSNGKTKIKCTIKTADGKDSKVKTADVYVKGGIEVPSKGDDDGEKKQEDKGNGATDQENAKEDSTVAPKPLANTGEIVPILFIVVTMIALTFIIKKNIEFKNIE